MVTAERDRVQAELDTLRANVLKAAKQGKAEHGWCAEIDRIVDNLGLHFEPETYEATFNLRVKVRFDVTCDLEDGPGEDEEDLRYWVKNSLRVHTEGANNGHRMVVFMDADTDNVEFVAWDAELVEVEAQ